VAKCDEGYRCEVCGQDVEHILDSDLYLRYVLGQIPLERLHLQPERHIRCNPAIAQYICDPRFPVVILDTLFGKQHLDPQYVMEQEQLITRAWQRLQAIPKLGLSIAEYPLSMTPFSESEIPS
jgi:hypothetical protein